VNTVMNLPVPSGSKDMFNETKLALRQTPHSKCVGGSVGKAPPIPGSGTGRRSVVRFAPRSLYPPGKQSQIPM